MRFLLGARRWSLMKLIIGQGLKLVRVRIAVGVLGALLLKRLMSTLLFGIVSVDAVLILAASTLLVLVATAASTIPARPATRVDPVTALRHD